MSTGTVRPAGSGRRVVRRPARPAIDQARDTALAELPVELHQLVRAYADSMRDGMQIRLELSTALTQNGLRWWQVDRVARQLA